MQVINKRATWDQDILTLWDGESYEMYCGYFCTNRCAQEFGNDAFDAGFRRS
jgi:YHS domain-containing protein